MINFVKQTQKVSLSTHKDKSPKLPLGEGGNGAAIENYLLV